MPWPDSRRHPPHSPLLRDVRSSPSAVTPASRVAPLALRGTRSTRKPGDSAAAPSIDIPRSGRSAGCSTTKDYRVPPSRKGTYSLCHCLAALTSRFPQPRRPRCSHTAHDEHNPHHTISLRKNGSVGTANTSPTQFTLSRIDRAVRRWCMCASAISPLPQGTRSARVGPAVKVRTCTCYCIIVAHIFLRAYAP